jgi:YtcA-like protein
MTTRYGRAPLVVLLPIMLGGCTRGTAPAFQIFGAFFPAWLMCALVGAVGAIVARILFVTTGLSDILPFQLFVCTAIGVLCGALTWLLFFG